MRKALQIAKRSAQGFALLLAVTVAGVLIAVQFRPVRGWVRDQVLAAIRGSLHGQLFVDDVRWPSLGHLDVSGVLLRDRRGVRVLSLPALTIDLRVGALLSGRVEIDRVDADHLYVDLADFGDQTGLLSVFASDTASVPDPKADLSPLTVAIRSLCLSEGSLLLQPSAAYPLSVRRLNTCVQLRLGRSLDLTLRELRAELLQDAKPLLTLVTSERVPALAPISSTDAPSVSAMRAALSGKLRFRTSDDLAFDAQLAARGFSAATLRTLGVESDVLRGAVDANVHAHGVGRRAAFRADVRAIESDLQVTGELSAERVLWTHWLSQQVALGRVTTRDFSPLAFELDARVDLAASDKIAGHFNLVRGRYGAYALPETSVEVARKSDGAIDVHALEARYGDALLSAVGTLEPDGRLDASAKLAVPQLGELPLQALLPNLSGGLSAQVHLRRSANTHFSADAELALRSFQLQGQQAQRLSLQVRASGSPQRPQLKAQLSASQLQIAGEAVAQLDVQLEGGPDRYHVSAQADGQRLNVDGWLEAKQHSWDGGFTFASDIGPAPIAVDLPLVRYVPGADIELHQLRASYLDASLFVDGTVGLDQRASRLRLAAVVPDLAAVSQPFVSSEVPGRVELSGELRGTIAKPRLDVRLNYADGFKLGKQPGALNLHAVADAQKAKLRINLSAKAGAASARGHLDSHWARNLPLSAAFEAAEHDLDLTIDGVSLGELSQPDDPDLRAPIDGPVSAHLHAHGNSSQLRVESQAHARLHRLGDPASVDLALEARYEKAKLSARVDAADKQGQLATFEFSDELDVERLIAQPSDPRDLVVSTRWDASAEFAERRVRDLPGIRAFGIGPELAPLMLSTSAHVTHQPHAEPMGELTSTWRWEPAAPAPQPIAATSCSDAARGSLIVSGRLAEGNAVIQLMGGSRAQPAAIAIETGLHVKLAELLAGQFTGLGPLKLQVQLKRLDLASLPIVCERGAGVVSASVVGGDLFDKLANMKLEADAERVQWDHSPPVDVVAHAHAAGDDLLLDAQFTHGAGKLSVDGQLPIGFRVGDPARIVNRAGALLLKTHFQHIAAASVLAFVPGVARVSGALDGAIDVSGTLQTPVARGSVQLDDVSLTLPRLGQRFSHVRVKASLDGRTLRLEDGRVRDLDGSASIAARITLDSPQVWSAELNLKARNFPLRKSGVMVGHAAADAHIVARTTSSSTDVSVQLSSVALNLTAQDVAQVQSLDRHPEISFSDDAPKPEHAAAAEAPTTPATVRIVTTEPIWIRRDDFAVQMQVDLKLVLGGRTPDLTGKIELRRGYISLLGQSFDIKGGQVLLSGGSSIDPQLEITATHDTPGGTTVRLEVTGFVHAPQLAFFVNDKLVTAGEALAAISGRNDPSSNTESSAQAQLASAAIGMTTGLLSLGARREFGDWIPMFSIEQGDQTRVRVGFEADRLIPKFMRSFVRGAYVEGIMASSDNGNGRAGQSTGNTATANTASGSGVLLELLLPKSFVWAGQYGPGECWSADVAWRP